MIKHNTLKWCHRYYWFFIDGLNLERPLSGRGGGLMRWSSILKVNIRRNISVTPSFQRLRQTFTKTLNAKFHRGTLANRCLILWEKLTKLPLCGLLRCTGNSKMWTISWKNSGRCLKIILNSKAFSIQVKISYVYHIFPSLISIQSIDILVCIRFYVCLCIKVWWLSFRIILPSIKIIQYLLFI